MMPYPRHLRATSNPIRAVTRLARTVVWTALAVSISSGASAAPLTFTDSGALAADIQDTVDAFRTTLGALNANLPGSRGSGRREVNWDGVPNQFASPNGFPPDFFNVNSPRGSVYSTPGSGFEVSANLASGQPLEFDNLEPGISADFTPFSPQRLFTAVGSTITDVHFFIPGTTAPAFVTGFGAVFTGVAVANTTFIQLFDRQDDLIASVYAPAAGAGSLSFAGFFDTNARIGRVRITSGEVPLGSRLPGDRVAMDDFIYAEPVPEPATLTMLGAAVAAVVARRRRH